MRRLRRWLYGLAAGAFVLATVEIVAAGLPLARTRTAIGGVPVEIMARRDHPDGPAVVMAHGYACSHRVMYTYGYTLAHHGYTVYLLDLPGHGANSQPLAYDSDSGGPDPLQAGLDAVVRYAAARHPGVAILGHSMGAGAVAQYGYDHPDVAATIAISTGRGPATPELPHNLLLMVGAWEFPMFKSGSLDLFRQAGGDAVGTLRGNLSEGTARQLVVVPGAEHILVLANRGALARAVSWLDGTFGLQVASPYLDARLAWLALAFLGAAVLAQPASRGLAAGPGSLPAPPATRPRATVIVFVIAAAGAPLLASVTPDNWMPLATAGYVASYFGYYGLLTLAGAAVLGVMRKWPLRRWLTRRGALAAAGLGLYLLLAFGLPTQYTCSQVVPTWQRLPWAFVTLPPLLLYFAGAELLICGAGTWRAALAMDAAHKGLTLLSLAAAIFALDAPFFLALLLPVLALVFVFFALLDRWVYGAGRNPLIGPLLGALALSSIVAAIFPLVR